MKDSEVQAIHSVLAATRPTKSGVDFYLYRSGIMMEALPDVANTPTLPDEELIKWYEEYAGLKYEDLREFVDFDTYRTDLIDRAKGVRPRAFLGGAGITWRTVEELNHQIPALQDRMLEETGKVVFLGNGLSPVPLLISERYRAGVVKEPPVIVDLFDYQDIYTDFQSILGEFMRRNITPPPPLPKCYRTLSSIVAATQEGSLVATKYYVGSGTVPKALQDASLAINCHGPNDASLQEQSSLLRVGGDLYTTYIPDQPLPNFHIEPTRPAGPYESAAIIHRIR